jgi:flagellar hook-associated protein 3 FlgL
LTAGDIFSVKGQVAGYYLGDGGDLSVEVGKDNSFAYNITGEEVFTDQGKGTVNMLKVLNDLKTALESNDPDTIGAQIDNLKSAQDQVIRYTAKIGSRMNSLEITSNNHESLTEQVSGLLSNVEDADMAQLMTDYQLKEVALQATYTLAGKMADDTILNFLK